MWKCEQHTFLNFRLFFFSSSDMRLSCALDILLNCDTYKPVSECHGYCWDGWSIVGNNKLRYQYIGCPWYSTKTVHALQRLTIQYLYSTTKDQTLAPVHTFLCSSCNLCSVLVMCSFRTSFSLLDTFMRGLNSWGGPTGEKKLVRD